MVRALAAIGLVGCSFNHGSLPATGDGAMIGGDATIDDASGTADAMPADAATMPDAQVMLGDWGAPQLVTALNSNGYDDDPTLTADLLEVCFDSDRDGSADIWCATRTTALQAWGAPAKAVALSTNAIEGEPEFSGDGLTIWFGRYSGSTDWDIYVSTRATRSSGWSTPALVTQVNSSATDFHLSANATLTRALLNSNRPNVQATYDVYETTRSSPAASWSTPSAVGELNTSSNESNVNLSGDGLTVYFDSDRPGASSRDLYVATRATPTGTFGTPQRIVELVSGARDSDPAVSPDQRYMIFASDRSGNMQLYQTSR